MTEEAKLYKNVKIMTKILYQPIEHNKQKRILVKFEFNDKLIKKLRETTDAKWSKTLKAWHIADTEENRIKCKIQLNKKVQIIAIKTNDNNHTQTKITIHPLNEHILPIVKQHLVLKAYSQNTHKTYLNEISIFLKTIGNNKAEDFTVVRLKDYLQYCFEKLRLSENTLHSRINALKFYYEQVLGREKFFWEVPRPKKKLILPKLLNEEELKRLFNALTNKKHKAMLFTAYSAGLRLSEIIHLKLNDIDSKRMQIFIENAKGKKDRYVNLSPVLLDILRAYLKIYTPKPIVYLFESEQTKTQYPARTVQQIFINAKLKAGIKKEVGIHSLRHSFATHLLDKGTDIKYIKDLLGHFDIKTTERYLHVSKQQLVNIISPLDDLMKNEKIDW